MVCRRIHILLGGGPLELRPGWLSGLLQTDLEYLAWTTCEEEMTCERLSCRNLVTILYAMIAPRIDFAHYWLTLEQCSLNRNPSAH